MSVLERHPAAVGGVWHFSAAQMIDVCIPGVFFLLKRKLFPHWSGDSSPNVSDPPASQLPADFFKFLFLRPNINESSKGKVPLLECEPEHTQHTGWAHLALQW